jgi:integrase
MLVGDLVARLLTKKASGELPHAKALAWDEARWKRHLASYFSLMKTRSVNEDRLSAYIATRKAEGAAAGTINRELSLLRRAFKIHRDIPCPHFPKLTEDNVRRGFLEDEKFKKLAAETEKEGLWLRALLEIGATYGLRKGEMLSLRVGQVDTERGRVRLEAEQTKNSKGRAFTLTEKAKALVFELIAGKQPDDFLFTRPDGSPVKDFRKAWRTVCERAGVPGLMVHDLRRTAVRSMVRAGISDNVAMRISGHKTRAVFDRYDITDETDLDLAAKLLEKRGQ